MDIRLNQLKEGTQVPFLNNVDLAYNEVITNTSLNRNFEKLLSNDVYLIEKAETEYSKIDFIGEYVPGHTYNKGDVVIYIEERYDEKKNADGDTIRSVHTVENLFILKSLIDNNDNKPEYEIVEGLYYFNASGWKNENNIGSVFFTQEEDNEDTGRFKDKTNLNQYLEPNISSDLYLGHEINKEKHRFGELSYKTGDDNDISNKILLKDFSNINPNRKYYFWPGNTYPISRLMNLAASSTGILPESTFRYWQNGIIEYSFAYVFTSNEIVVLDDAGNRATSSIELYPNTLHIDSSVGNPDSSDYNENYKYFNSPADFQIFKQNGSGLMQEYGQTRQKNVLPYQNVYSTTLKFPIEFLDLNYMTFNMSVSKNNTSRQSVNAITFVNKTRKSISPIFVVANPDSEKLEDSVLIKNTKFYCQIIGKCNQRLYT